MAKIKFKWIIKDPDMFQKGNLSDDAVKMEMPSTTGKMMLMALPFCVFLTAVLLSCLFAKVYICNYRIINPVFLVVGVLGGFLLLWVHELLHAVVYPKGATVFVGFYPKNFAFMALASYPIKRGRFVLMSLLPFVLGIVPLVCFIAFPYYWMEWNSVMFGLAIMGIVSPYPDCYNVWQVLRQAPKGSYIQYYGNDTYFIPSAQKSLQG